MSIQSRLSNFKSGLSDLADRFADLPDPPGDAELNSLIAPDWMYDFDVDQLEGIDTLRRRIRDAEYATDPVEEWSYILGDFISYGNTKLANHIAIVNMNSATDCINLGTKYCQVGDHECYAARNEDDFPKPRGYRRKQQIIWDHLNAATWAAAFRRHYKRKDIKPTTIRFSESGDFRHRHDLLKVDEIARRLNDLVDVYTYTASAWLDWSEVDHFTVNQSSPVGDYGVRNYVAVDSHEQIPDDAVWCPHDRSDGDVKCGDCRLCIDENGPDVYIEKFFSM